MINTFTTAPEAAIVTLDFIKTLCSSHTVFFRCDGFLFFIDLDSSSTLNLFKHPTSWYYYKLGSDIPLASLSGPLLDQAWDLIGQEIVPRLTDVGVQVPDPRVCIDNLPTPDTSADITESPSSPKADLFNSDIKSVGSTISQSSQNLADRASSGSSTLKPSNSIEIASERRVHRAFSKSSKARKIVGDIVGTPDPFISGNTCSDVVAVRPSNKCCTIS